MKLGEKLLLVLNRNQNNSIHDDNIQEFFSCEEEKLVFGHIESWFLCKESCCSRRQNLF